MKYIHSYIFPLVTTATLLLKIAKSYESV